MRRSPGFTLAGVFGLSPEDRTETVRAMLARAPWWSAGYWLQLGLATAIATLGLLLGSTAVVIGAMLVSPLMTPIVELGMGLAIGSPLLVVRSTARIVTSVVVVIASAAVLTILVPIHEVTHEISSRTSPTLLDLGIAACCALAAVYATIRAGSETASTAAGTSVGIALVPPLCVAGFGLGTGELPIASGSSLLFTANLFAILLVSALGFVALGYGRVDVAALERRHLETAAPKSVTARAARSLSAFFATRLGPAVRLGMPVVLVAAVFFPLERALGEVSWEIRVRTAARDALRAAAPRSVDSSVRVERHQVTIRLIAIGNERQADALRKLITERVRAAAGVTPAVDVIAVPDADALAHAQTERRDSAGPPPPPPADPGRIRGEAEQVLTAWPADAVGPLLAWRLEVPPAGPVGVRVLHLGAGLGAAAQAVLEKSLSTALHAEVRIDDVALAPAATTKAGEVLRSFPDATDLSLCLERPEADAGANALDDLDAIGDPRVKRRPGASSSARWSTTGCAATTDAGSDAGDAGDADSD